VLGVRLHVGAATIIPSACLTARRKGQRLLPAADLMKGVVQWILPPRRWLGRKGPLTLLFSSIKYL
jgi:hypothetical protein